MEKKLKDLLPEPKTLLEIAQFTIKHPQYSTNAIAEILE